MSGKSLEIREVEWLRSVNETYAKDCIYKNKLIDKLKEALLLCVDDLKNEGMEKYDGYVKALEVLKEIE